MQEETVVFWLFTFVIAGGVAVIITAMRNRARVLEMAHRERLAMIERGHPMPEDLNQSIYEDRQPAARSNRLLSGGIVVVGFGLALGLLLAFASREPQIAVGVGGAIVILGAAFIVTAYVVHGQGRSDAPAVRDSRRTFDRLPPPPPPSSAP
jgi:Domain of unknown function (DUF6249)